MASRARVWTAIVMRDVVCLRGGLGNQLFQVAFAEWLSQSSHREVTFDISCLRDSDLPILKLGELGEYISNRVLIQTRYWPAIEGRFAPVASAMRIARGPRHILIDNHSNGRNDIDFTRPAWWFGYWQRDRYAKAILPQLLDATASDPAASQPTLGIHVRRGDMVDKPSAVPVEWFRHATAFALAAVSSPLTIRVWSDDPDWCAANLDIGHDFEIAKDGDVIRQLSDLGKCRALVISRSTYSWWAARIATEHAATIVYPTPWAPGPGPAPEDATVIPGSWIPLPCFRH